MKQQNQNQNQQSNRMPGQHEASKKAAEIASNVIHFEWVGPLTYWIFDSATKLSKMILLLGTMWYLISMSTTKFIESLIGTTNLINVNALVTVAFVDVPELLSIIAIIDIYTKCEVYFYDRNNKRLLVWSILLAIPTLVFAGVTLASIAIIMYSNSSGAPTVVQLPPFIVASRGVAAYVYVLIAFVYERVNGSHIVNMLKAKDDRIDQLQTCAVQKEQAYQQEKAAMQSEFENLSLQKEQAYKAEIDAMQCKFDEVYMQLETAMHDKNAMHTALMQASKGALQAWGDNVISWLDSLSTSVHIDDIAAQTGIDKRAIKTALDRKEIQVRGTNPNLIWVKSLREYLEKNPPKSKVSAQNKAQNKEPIPMKRAQDTDPIAQIVNE